jgi:hypothetical protein
METGAEHLWQTFLSGTSSFKQQLQMDSPISSDKNTIAKQADTRKKDVGIRAYLLQPSWFG